MTTAILGALGLIVFAALVLIAHAAGRSLGHEEGRAELLKELVADGSIRYSNARFWSSPGVLAPGDELVIGTRMDVKA